MSADDRAQPAGQQLGLASRQALPRSMRYLEQKHARSTWRQHPNYGELSDFWLAVHSSLRQGSKQLAHLTGGYRAEQLDPRAFGGHFAPAFNHFMQHLEGHHRIEDLAYFPKFRLLDPRIAAGIELLEGDHALIHQQVVASVVAARELVASIAAEKDRRSRAADAFSETFATLVQWLERHLADEEDLIIPAMLEHGERRVR